MLLDKGDEAQPYRATANCNRKGEMMSTIRTEWSYEVQEIPHPKMKRDYLREVLSEMGSCFWELVSVMDTDDSYLLIFKRPKTERQKEREGSVIEKTV